jgi:hypothetical protein
MPVSVDDLRPTVTVRVADDVAEQPGHVLPRPLPRLFGVLRRGSPLPDPRREGEERGIRDRTTGRLGTVPCGGERVGPGGVPRDGEGVRVPRQPRLVRYGDIRDGGVCGPPLGLPGPSVGEGFRHLDRRHHVRVEHERWPDAPGTRHGEQSQLPVARPAPEELQHRRGVGADQPLRLGHRSPPVAPARARHLPRGASFGQLPAVSYSLPRIRSTAQHPRTCGPSPRR